jgi:hypothetical protein
LLPNLPPWATLRTGTAVPGVEWYAGDVFVFMLRRAALDASLQLQRRLCSQHESTLYAMLLLRSSWCLAVFALRAPLAGLLQALLWA